VLAKILNCFIDWPVNKTGRQYLNVKLSIAKPTENTTNISQTFMYSTVPGCKICYTIQ